MQYAVDFCDATPDIEKAWANMRSRLNALSSVLRPDHDGLVTRGQISAAQKSSKKTTVTDGVDRLLPGNSEPSLDMNDDGAGQKVIGAGDEVSQEPGELSVAAQRSGVGVGTYLFEDDAKWSLGDVPLARQGQKSSKLAAGPSCFSKALRSVRPVAPLKIVAQTVRVPTPAQSR